MKMLHFIPWLIPYGWVLFYWIIGEYSSDTAFLFFSFVCVLQILFAIAKFLPFIGRIMGLLFIFAPAFAWWKGVYNTSHYHSDGSAAAMVIYFAVVVISVFLVVLGICLIEWSYIGKSKNDDYSNHNGIKKIEGLHTVDKDFIG